MARRTRRRGGVLAGADGAVAGNEEVVGRGGCGGQAALKQEGGGTASVGRDNVSAEAEPDVGDDGSGLVILADVEDAGTAADDPAIGDAIGETEAGAEVVLVEVVGVVATAIAATPREEAGGAADGIDGELVEGVLAVVDEFAARGV